MTAPSTSWNLVRVFGTWHSQGGQLKPGKYTVTIPERITNHTDDAIIPAGIYDSGDLQTSTSAAPSLDILVPANDDPDNDQTGWKVQIKVSFTDGSAPETYTINVPVAARPTADGGTGDGVNLRTVVFPSQAPQTVALYRVGVPGGLAQLNSDGDVVDSDGVVVTGGGGAVAAADITDSTTVGQNVIKAADAAAARAAIGAGTSSLALGTTGSTAKAGNYAPTWTEVTSKPAVIAAGADAATARTAIGAGTSNLAVGSTSTTAKAGDYVPAWSEVTSKPAVIASGADAATARSAIGALAEGTFVPFSKLAGADDDAKLAAGITALQSPTLKGRTILLDENRDYTFTTQVTVPSGFSLQGTFRPQDQPRSSRPVGNRVLLRMAGGSSGKGWLKGGTGSTFGVSVSNLSIDGDANSTFFDGNEDNGGVLWTSTFRDISIQNAKSVFGSKANRLNTTACSRGGFWNINNVRETSWNDGGSDFVSNPEMMLVDSPPELLGFNEYLMTLSFMSNARYKHVYCTAEGHAALLISGSNNSSQNVSIDDWVAIEGRNESQPSPGALVRMTQGQAMIRGTRFAFGMANPALITNRTDKGIIHVAGGNLVVQDCTYQRGYTVSAWSPPTAPTLGAAVDESVPFIYVASGAKVRVRNIIGNGPTTGTFSWTGKPIVKQALPGLADCDDSVTLVTAQVAAAPNAAGDTTTGLANTGTSITINKPANVVNGDLLIAAVHSRAASAVYTTPPSGWTAITPSTDIVTAGVVRLYWKWVTTASSEPASYTWAGGGSGRHVGIITRITGSVSSPVDVAGAAATGISPPDRIILPSVTTVAELDALIMVGTGNGTGGTSPTFTVPAPGSVIASVQTTTGASETSMTLAIETAVATGASGTRVMTASGTSSTGVGYMAGIKSAG